MANTNPQFNLRLDPDLKVWLEEEAKRMRLSQTWLVNQAIKEMMQREQQKTA